MSKLSKALQAAAGNAAEPVYIEDVFSTYLYTGNGSTQTITNGIDLSTNGGLVWIKARTNAASGDNNHELYDTARGVRKVLNSNQQSAENTLASNGLTAFGTTGFTVSDDTFGSYGVNGPNARTFVSWTFRKQAKFFDVVTWTGNNADGRFISHSLGSTPGMVIIKNLTSTYDWVVWHRSLANPSKYLVLNSTAATATDIYGPFGSYDGGFTTNASCFTSTGFYVAADARSNLNANNYVAYVFAHDAGGFGLTGTDNVISCGSFTATGSAQTINLGYEPQWVLFHRSSEGGGGWFMEDTMRGMPVSGDARVLFANTSQAEGAASVSIRPTSTGFSIDSGILNAGDTFIYIAIRRGPMKTPTTGTSVFTPNAYAGGTAGISFNLGFAPDALLTMRRNTSNFDILQSRLIGQNYLFTNTTDSELGGQSGIPAWDANTGTTQLTTATAVTGWNGSGSTYVNEAFRRAPGFFDVVCYTGTGSARTVNHNLGVVPEMMIVKRRSSSGSDWWVYNAPRGATKSLRFTDEAEFTLLNIWNNTAPTSSVFTVGADSAVNGGGSTYVWYGFASCPGVSKVGSYTGTGALQTINCGFTGGARFVLIKRTDSTGDWYVYDSARGISSGNDPYLLMNSTAAEVTGTNYVDTYSAGFEISSTAPAAINANGGSFIFLAIA